jgi:hypothetical protein
MTKEQYTDRIQELYLKRHLLVTELSENGPEVTYTVRYDPFEDATEYLDFNFVEAIAELDQEILKLTSEAKSESWFKDYVCSLESKKFNPNGLPPFEF